MLKLSSGIWLGTQAPYGCSGSPYNAQQHTFHSFLSLGQVIISHSASLDLRHRHMNGGMRACSNMHIGCMNKELLASCHLHEEEAQQHT